MRNRYWRILSGAVLAFMGAEVSAQSCNKVVWQPTEAQVCNLTWGIQRAAKASHAASYDDRLYCLASGPANGGEVLGFAAYKGKYVSLMSHQKPLSGVALDSAEFSAEMYIPNDHKYWSSGRLALGIRIGDPKNPGNCNSGGCPPKDQNGSSVRINFKMNQKANSMQMSLYSYNLDRPGQPKMTQPAWGGGSAVYKLYGQGKTMSASTPKGQWVKAVLKVKLNTVGKSDGRAELTLLNNKGGVIGKADLTNVVYRKDKKWKILGPFLTEKYNTQGSPSQTQSVYYRNYKIASCQ